MNELITVEFFPGVPAGKTKAKLNIPPFYGCLGETLRSLLEESVYKEKYGKARKDNLIPVRFPLIVPNSRLAFVRNEHNPLDPEILAEEGQLLSPRDLHVVDRVPVSLYKRSPLKSLADIDRLTDASVYFNVVGKRSILALLHEVGKKYPCQILWKREAIPGTPPAVLIEARLYGLDTIVPTYEAETLCGAAIEVITRPWPNGRDRKAGVYASRMNSDVYLFSKNSNYITHLDGVDLKRETTTSAKLISFYGGFMSPLEATKQRHDLDTYKKPPESGWDVKESVINVNTITEYATDNVTWVASGGQS